MTETTPLIRLVAAQIVEFARSEGFAEGQQLAERKLADQIRVSRSPVKSALSLLEKQGVVQRSARGGYVLAPRGEALDNIKFNEISSKTDELYARLVEDRLSESLPARITESALMRSYGMSRTQLLQVLNRASNEGWIERLPGHGWAFLPVLTSLGAYKDSYRFRLIMEPAAILEPGFILNAEALEQRLRQQRAFVTGAFEGFSDAEIFEMNSGLHETIMECSGNSFFIDSFRRLNRLRRLMEYRQKLDRTAALERTHEHIEIAEALLAGKRERASEMLRRHLDSVGHAKSQKKKT
jgi:DNA-binding GntR family transcriptional regulator